MAGIRRFWDGVTPEKCTRYIRHLRKVIPGVISESGRASGFWILVEHIYFCFVFCSFQNPQFFSEPPQIQLIHHYATKNMQILQVMLLSGSKLK